MKFRLPASSIPRDDTILVPRVFKRLYFILIVMLAVFSGHHQLAVQAQEIVPQDNALFSYYQAEHLPTASPSATFGQIMKVVIGKSKYTHPVPSSKAQELLVALNHYREKKGKGKLVWNATLAVFAQQRADSFQKKDDLDGHAGFNDLIAHHDGFKVLGFWSLAENSAIGQQVSAEQLIEAVYGTSAAHNATELNESYLAVGIGVAGTATDFIYGGVPVGQ